MTSFKIIVAFLTFLVVSQAKVVLVKNGRSSDLELNVDGTPTTVLSGAVATLVLSDGWSGSITALPSDAEVTNGPKTTIKFSLGTISDTYVVSLVQGYNVGAKIIPKGSVGCSASLCTANVNALCSAANQVANSSGTVVACENDPTVMATVCPLAQVSEDDSTTVQSCSSATSYLVIIN